MMKKDASNCKLLGTQYWVRGYPLKIHFLVPAGRVLFLPFRLSGSFQRKKKVRQRRSRRESRSDRRRPWTTSSSRRRPRSITGSQHFSRSTSSAHFCTVMYRLISEIQQHFVNVLVKKTALIQPKTSFGKILTPRPCKGPCW